MCFSLFQDSTINPVGLYLSVKIEHQDPTSRAAKKQVLPFMHDLLFTLPFLFLPTLNFDSICSEPYTQDRGYCHSTITISPVKAAS